jgi:hypothetical protein
MRDPRDRLRRRIPGADLGEETPGVTRLFRRGEFEDRKDPVPARDAKALPTLTLRKARKLADPTPNAPLLIRIVRTPYGLHPSGKKRARYIAEVPKVEPVDRTAEIRAALAERERVRFTSAGRRRPRAFTIRPSTWVLLPPAPSEDPV